MRAERATAVILRSAASCVMPALVCVLLLLANPRGAGSRTERVILLPKLHAGQAITYEIRFPLVKNTRPQTTSAPPLGPSGDQITGRDLLGAQSAQFQFATQRALPHPQ